MRRSHEVGEAVLQKTLVDGHELCNESFNVKYHLTAHAQSMFIVGRHRCDFGLQLTIAIFQDFLQQFLKY